MTVDLIEMKSQCRQFHLQVEFVIIILISYYDFHLALTVGMVTITTLGQFIAAVLFNGRVMEKVIATP